MAISERAKLRSDQLHGLGLKFDFNENAYIGDFGGKHFYVPALDIQYYGDEKWDELLKEINTYRKQPDEVQERRIPLDIKGQRRNKYMKLRFGTIIKECPKCGREMVYSCTCDWDPKESDYDWSEFLVERHFILMNSKKRFQKDDNIKSKVVEFPFWNESDFSREIVSIDAELFFNAYEVMKGYPRATIMIDSDKESLRVLLNDGETRVQQEISNTYFKISKNTIINE